jgi:hypothetical protein
VQGYIARENDVRDAIAFYDPQGTRARRRGPDKHRKDGEFITPGPDFYGAATATINSVAGERKADGEKSSWRKR